MRCEKVRAAGVKNSVHKLKDEKGMKMLEFCWNGAIREG